MKKTLFVTGMDEEHFMKLVKKADKGKEIHGSRCYICGREEGERMVFLGEEEDEIYPWEIKLKKIDFDVNDVRLVYDVCQHCRLLLGKEHGAKDDFNVMYR